MQINLLHVTIHGEDVCMIVISRTYGIGLRPYNPVEAGSFSAPPLKIPAAPTTIMWGRRGEPLQKIEYIFFE